MRAAEAYWQGKWETFETKIDSKAPTSVNIAEAMRTAVVSTGQFREGSGFRAKTLQACEPEIVHFGIWKEATMVELVSEEATSRGSKALTELRELLGDFRSAIKNDLASIKAASDRMQSEMEQMRSRYAAAQEMLVSERFERAVANAERMAVALKAISELAETKLSVAVFSGGQAREAGLERS